MPVRELWSRIDRRPLVLLGALLLAAILTGGSNRGDVLSLILVRLAAIVCVGAAIAWMPSDRLRAVKLPLLLLGALAAWMVVQLIPLPPMIWTSLPGRERLAETATVMGMPQPWMPISIVPLRTFGSLIAVITPVAAILLVAWLPKKTWPIQAIALAAIGLTSALLAVIQVSGPTDSMWYLYEVRQKGGAVGFFANRNHQAALLASMLPILVAIGLEWMRPNRSGKSAKGMVVALCCAAAVLFLLPLIFITGSRAGLVLTPIAIAGTVVLTWPTIRRARVPRWLFGTVIGSVAVVTAGLMAILLSGRSLSLQRLSTTEILEERRLVVVDPIVQLIHQNIPIGTGFGTFDAAFRAIEPYSQLYRTYLNHAHSDPLEFLSDGGIPAAIILVTFVLWWFRAVFLVWFRRDDVLAAKAATIATALLMLASWVDYPLRTPLMSIVFAILVGWIGAAVHHQGIDDETPADRSRLRR